MGMRVDVSYARVRVKVSRASVHGAFADMSCNVFCLGFISFNFGLNESKYEIVCNQSDLYSSLLEAGIFVLPA